MEMNGDQAAVGLFYVLLLVLVGSALVSRRLSLTGTLGMVLAWIAIFAVVLTIFSFRRELGLVATRVRTEIIGAPVQTVDGQTLRIAVSDDGHYWVDGSINGLPTRFLIDSGASITALSEPAAKAAGLNVSQEGFPAILQTANGHIEARRSNIATLTLGPVRTSDLPVVVSAAFGDVNVLGMNMLSRLKSWSVQNGEMVLTP